MARVIWHATSTPLQPAPRLGATLGFEPGCLWVKRDDLTGLAGGGNKARKLEYLCADALEKGCDTLLTSGAAQSNHARMTAAAAAALGLRCVVVLFGSPPAKVEGNLALDQLLGAEIVWAGDDRLADALGRAAMRLVSRGAKVYEIPLGGSSPVGALGYVGCADELVGQAPPGAIVVCADGSGGTHAGLVAGFGDHRRVLGVNVGFSDLEATVGRLTAETAVAAGRAHPVGEPWFDAGQPEPYGTPTEATREALELTAHQEGLILDPVYTGRAMAALISRRRDGRMPADQPVVFLHTGGLPALFTERYRSWFPAPPRLVTVRALTPADDTWVRDQLGRVPGGAPVEARGLVAVDGSRRVGLATYVVSEAGAELTAVKVIDQRQGIGRILVEHLRPVVSGAGATRLWARIANDEVETFAFLQRCGFRLTEIRVDDLILERSV